MDYKGNYMIKIRKGFTLSEVMLVLSVIGVISALTIPGLIQSTQNRILVAQLKKVYSVLSQALTAVTADNDGDITSVFASDNSSTNVLNVFANKMNVLKNCGGGTGCWTSTPYKYLNGDQRATDIHSIFSSGNYALAQLSDGASIALYSIKNSCTSNGGDGPLKNKVCGTLEVDVNGTKGPNQLGRDAFIFFIAQSGIYPYGAFFPALNNCTTGSNEGTSCANKILTEGAMNY